MHIIPIIVTLISSMAVVFMYVAFVVIISQYFILLAKLNTIFNSANFLPLKLHKIIYKRENIIIVIIELQSVRPQNKKNIDGIIQILLTLFATKSQKLCNFVVP